MAKLQLKEAGFLNSELMVFAEKAIQDISLWLREEGFSEAIIEAFKGTVIL